MRDCIGLHDIEMLVGAKKPYIPVWHSGSSKLLALRELKERRRRHLQNPFSGAVLTASWHTSQEPKASFPRPFAGTVKTIRSKVGLLEMTDSRAMKWVERWKKRGAIPN